MIPFNFQIAEMHSKMNELEEAALVESGRARIAGTRTKMELAWQKERESQKKLISELSTMSRDLKATLLEVEKEKDREKLESRRKNDTMKSAFEEEQVSPVEWWCYMMKFFALFSCPLVMVGRVGRKSENLNATSITVYAQPLYFRRTQSDKSQTCNTIS